MRSWQQLQKQIVACEKCDRLTAHCRSIALAKRKAFAEWEYWGKPIPNFGDPSARLLIVGLAPAAHGANRTGRMFTGDRSGDFLFRAMHETGFASQAHSTDREDGLTLTDAAITAVAHCAPPDNKPTPAEIENCFPYLEQTVELMPNLKGMLALGRIGFEGCLKLYRSRGWLADKKKPQFGHGVLHTFESAPFLLCSFHPSQQNTFTGRLTAAMLRDVFDLARREIDTEKTIL